jgi:hypothetical protein
LERDHAVEGRQAGKVEAGVASPGLVLLDARAQDRKRGRNAVGLEKIRLVPMRLPCGLCAISSVPGKPAAINTA